MARQAADPAAFLAAQLLARADGAVAHADGFFAVPDVRVHPKLIADAAHRFDQVGQLIGGGKLTALVGVQPAAPTPAAIPVVAARRVKCARPAVWLFAGSAHETILTPEAQS